MLREIEEGWNALPWYVKLALILLGLNYIRERKGFLWSVLQILVIGVAIAPLFVVIFECYLFAQFVYYLQAHEEVMGYVGLIVLLYVIAFCEIVWIVKIWRKKRGTGKMKYSVLWYVIPALFGVVGSLPLYFLVKNRELAENILKVGMWQNIAVLSFVLLSVLFLL